MATAATISARLILNSKPFQQGVKAAEKATVSLQARLKSLDAYLRLNSKSMQNFAKSMGEAGKKMTMFVTLPILGFFTLIIKKALEADTALSKVANESLARMNAALVELGIKFLPLFIQIIDWITMMITKFNEADPATQKFIALVVAFAALAGPIMQLASWLIGTAGFLAEMGITAGTVTTALTTLISYISTVAIPAIIAFTVANAAWLVPLLLVIATVYLVYKAFKTNFGGITTTVKQLWFLIKNAFSGIIKAIGAVIKATLTMMAVFAKVKLPPALTPGSPTPFEIGLRGISKEMDNVSNKSLPKLSVGMGVASAVTGVGGGQNVNITDNRRFSAGMDANALQIALNNKLKGIAGNL